jgi:hypothetical protein
MAVHIFQVITHKPKQVTIYSEGIAFGSAAAGFATMHWADLSEYRFRTLQKIFLTPLTFHMKYTYQFTFQGSDGRILVINERLAQINALAQLIEEKVIQRLGPAAEESYGAGKPVSFGPISVSRNGIDNGRDTATWNEVFSVEVLGGNLVVTVAGDQHRGKWHKIPAETIPNLPVLLAMIASPTIKKLNRVNYAHLRIGL